MTWRTIAGTETDSGAPVTSELMKALADNPAAIANADSGAPAVVDAALDTTATNTGRDWVLARTALATFGAVGTYAFCVTASSPVAAGDTIAGGSLNPGSISEEEPSPGTFVLEMYEETTTLSGTWRAMGVIANGTVRGATLFLRVA